jgi:acyl-CoA synthetase (AMP-forming)/AMP-acid ligase II
VTVPAASPSALSVQSGPDALVEERVGGATVRCYASRPHSLVELLDTALPVHGDAVLLVDPALGREVTYARFAALVEGAAAALRARGLADGDRVAVLARNGLEAAVAIWACARAGLVHVGLPVDAPVARLRELVALTGPGLLLAQPDLADLGAAAAHGAEDLPVPVPLADAAEVLLGDERPWRRGGPLPDQDTTYMLIATSGTTGRPKAVRVTGRMAGHAAACYTRTLGLTPTDRTAIHLPFAWVSGSITQLAPAMLSGGSAVTMARFSAAELVAVAVEHRVTWLDVVPSIWELLLRAEGFALPALAGVRLAVFGGAPAPPGTLDRVRRRLPQLRLFDVYALSETCAPVTVLADAEALRRPGSVGRPAPYVDVRLVDSDGRDVLRGAPGELWVRSPAVTPGYWGVEPERGPVTADGWLRTGDLARLDDEGYLTVAGRATDLIIRGGVNIYPAEVERALLAGGLLADAAVVGVPSAVAGENVAAAVVAAPGAVVDVAALQRGVRDRLGVHAVPRSVRVLDDLPRNRNGKVDRAALRALFREQG